MSVQELAAVRRLTSGPVGDERAPGTVLCAARQIRGAGNDELGGAVAGSVGADNRSGK